MNEVSELSVLHGRTRKKGVRKFERNGKIFAYAMISIAVVHFLVFWVYINIDQFRLAFTFHTADGSEVFTLDNFKNVFNDLGRKDSIMVYSLLNTIKYWALTNIKLIVIVFVAYFIYKKVKGHKFFMFMFFVPSILPPIVLVTLFKNIISTQGPLAIILNNIFGFEMPALLQYHTTATNTILFFTFWAGLGVTFLILVGAMNRIPDSVIEAAKIDGCGWLRELFKIALPIIWETVSVLLILSISAIFISSGPILFFTNGNEYTHTYTLSFWIYIDVRNGIINYPSAVGLFYTIAALPFVIVSRLILSKFNKEVTY